MLTQGEKYYTVKQRTLQRKPLVILMREPSWSCVVQLQLLSKACTSGTGQSNKLSEADWQQVERSWKDRPETLSLIPCAVKKENVSTEKRQSKLENTT